MIDPVRIFILDDRPEHLHLINDFFSKTKIRYECYLAKGKDEYLKALMEFQPVVIIADTYIPRLDLKKALSIVLEGFKEVPFLVVTGSVPEKYQTGMFKLKIIDDVILKQNMVKSPGIIVLSIEK